MRVGRVSWRPQARLDARLRSPRRWRTPVPQPRMLAPSRFPSPFVRATRRKGGRAHASTGRAGPVLPGPRVRAARSAASRTLELSISSASTWPSSSGRLELVDADHDRVLATFHPGLTPRGRLSSIRRIGMPSGDRLRSSRRVASTSSIRPARRFRPCRAGQALDEVAAAKRIDRAS